MSEERETKLENALHSIARSVARLFVAVEKGYFNARSLVGDETLDLQVALEDVGIQLSLKELRETMGDFSSIIPRPSYEELLARVAELETEVRVLKKNKTA